MMRCYLSVIMGAVAAAYARPARADLPSCSELVIEADPSVASLWPGLLNVVRAKFDAREDIDRCAHVLLTSRDASILLKVILPDGRSAMRAISRREDVVPTLEALLVVPEPGSEGEPLLLVPEPGSEGKAAAPPPSASTPTPPAPLPVPLNAAPAPTPGVRPDLAPGIPERVTPAKPQASRVRIDLSALAGARIGDGHTGVGLGAVSFLDVYGWLVGFEGRADRYQNFDGRLAGAALELAVLGGRRFWVQDVALDLIAGPAAALGGTSTVKTLSPPVTMTSSEGPRPVPRLLFGARASFSARSTLHTFIGLDGDVGPWRVAAADRTPPGAQELPVWTVGLAVGATVGTP
jgi:hypothetical protein